MSLKWDKHFIRNLVIAIGVIFVRRGVRILADKYLLPNHPLRSGIVSIVVGILILYLPDGSLEYLGGYKKEIEKEIERDLEKKIEKNIQQELKEKDRI